jgi:hypothetical protein
MASRTQPYHRDFSLTYPGVNGALTHPGYRRHLVFFTSSARAVGMLLCSFAAFFILGIMPNLRFCPGLLGAP